MSQARGGWGRGSVAATDFRALEADDEAIDFFDAAGDLAGGGIEAVGDLDAVKIDHSVVTAFGENVDQHG